MAQERSCALGVVGDGEGERAALGQLARALRALVEGVELLDERARDLRRGRGREEAVGGPHAVTCQLRGERVCDERAGVGGGLDRRHGVRRGVEARAVAGAQRRVEPR